MDDPLSPAGRLRIGASLSWTWADSRYGQRLEDGTMVEEVEPLGFDLSRDRLGSESLPILAPLEESLAVAVGAPDLSLSLGTTRTLVHSSALRIPFDVDLGLTDWLTVGVSVPVIRQRTEVGLYLFADTVTSDLGLSPAAGGGGETALFLARLEAAVRDMEAASGSICGTSPGSAECASARDALEDGQAFLQAVSTGYASALFPFEGSDVGGALRTRLGSLDARFRTHGVTTAPSPASLPLAEGPLTRQDLGRVVSDPVFGIAGDSLATWQGGWEIGDVEIHGALGLLEGEREGEPGFFGVSSWLLGTGARVRLATGSVDDPASFFDRGSGDGQIDVEARVFGDLGLGRRLGIWTDVRYGLQLEGTVPRRIAPPDVILAPADTRADLSWNPGDYVDLEVAPRIRLTPELALAGRYRWFRKGADRYELSGGQDAGALPTPDLLEQETEEGLHAVGVSVVYSTLRAFGRGAADFPVEARVRYRRAVAGSGGLTPRTSRFDVGLRLFWTLWGS